MRAAWWIELKPWLWLIDRAQARTEIQLNRREARSEEDFWNLVWAERDRDQDSVRVRSTAQVWPWCWTQREKQLRLVHNKEPKSCS